ncbi:hypothetical protein MB84_27710 (plasmid) [Pandoraea oxalativorans]|uniref:Uncharacterized protein n=1 Tax=Pandoraea oxalativorans TaxID=573737 RepID=A0A0G3IBQ6_9BURK|nr:hypothetical protein MB84_27710 [Pandoraea oxalativorans]
MLIKRQRQNFIFKSFHANFVGYTILFICRGGEKITIRTQSRIYFFRGASGGVLTNHFRKIVVNLKFERRF